MLDAGPADVLSTYRVRFFTLEPTLPARPAHHTHTVGHLHVRHGPTRLAHVDRADRLYEAASRCSRGSEDIYPRSQPRAEGQHRRTASVCTIHASLVCVYMCLRGPCVTRAARRLTMATEPPAMIITIVVLRDWKYPLWIVLTELAFQNNF